MKKLRTELIALCEYASISKENQLNINGIFDELKTEKFPVGFTDKYLVATINGDPDKEYKLILQLEKNNNGHNLLMPTIVQAHTSQNGKSNLIIKLQMVGFESEGNYFFKLFDGSEEVGAIELNVTDVKHKEEGVAKILN